MALINVPRLVCDVFQTMRGVHKYRLKLIELDDEGNEPGVLAESIDADLSKRGVTRCKHNMLKGMTRPKRKEPGEDPLDVPGQQIEGGLTGNPDDDVLKEAVEEETDVPI